MRCGIPLLLDCLTKLTSTRWLVKHSPDAVLDVWMNTPSQLQVDRNSAVGPGSQSMHQPHMHHHPGSSYYNARILECCRGDKDALELTADVAHSGTTFDRLGYPFFPNFDKGRLPRLAHDGRYKGAWCSIVDRCWFEIAPSVWSIQPCGHTNRTTMMRLTSLNRASLPRPKTRKLAKLARVHSLGRAFILEGRKRMILGKAL